MSSIIEHTARCCNRAQWYDFWRLLRKDGAHRYFRKQDHYHNRVWLREQLDEYTVDGKVAVSVDQMDCDCSRWTSSNVMPAVGVLIERHLEHIYNDAEGPIYGMWFSKPVDKAEYVSRDLAMEAFEDGHAGSVSMSRYDEDGDYNVH